MEIVFWGLLFIVFYTYLGYGLLLRQLITIKRLFFKPRRSDFHFDLPEVTFVVAAYNEAPWIEAKMANSFDQDYPRHLIRYIFITDGSDDGTPEIIRRYPLPADVRMDLYHQPERKGKIAAINRILPAITSPVILFTDANTALNQQAVSRMVRHYADPNVGGVAGEKRIRMSDKDQASGAGEGLYWIYESLLKKWDAELYSVVGAAGELFSVRRELHDHIPPDTIVEDFYTTLKVAMKGYRVAYEPGAYAVESHSASVAEELKRKIRIAAGGLQALVRLWPLLNPFRYGVLTFQYLSHRVFRWTLAPLALPFIALLNIPLALTGKRLYVFILFLQCFFYGMALLGYFFEKKQLKFKPFFIPYYFCMMNYAVYRGFIRYISGKQTVLWEKARRA